MKEKVIQVSPFQRDRLVQLEEGLHNIDNAERTMEFSGQNVLFAGNEDSEIQIDREILVMAKGFLRGVVSELIYEYEPDPITGRDVRVKNENMQKVAGEIIEISKIIRNQ